MKKNLFRKFLALFLTENSYRIGSYLVIIMHR